MFLADGSVAVMAEFSLFWRGDNLDDFEGVSGDEVDPSVWASDGVWVGCVVGPFGEVFGLFGEVFGCG